MSSIKCVVVGTGAVGKTCMLMSYVYQNFPEDKFGTWTVFDDCAATVNVDGRPMTLWLFDSAGQSENDELRPLAYPETNVFLVCFSISDPVSFDHVKEKWVPEIRYHVPDAPIILVGTKIDLRNEINAQRLSNGRKIRPISNGQGVQLKNQIKAVKYLECSAKTRKGLTAIFEEAIRAVLSK